MPEDLLTHACTHLEFFGYTIEQQPDGWIFARHPVRCTFYLRAFSAGLRLFCSAGLGRPVAALREAWRDHVNEMNERASLCRFSLVADERGDGVRIRAVLPGTYDRRLFGMAIDMWHEDVGNFHRDAPPMRAARAARESGTQDEVPIQRTAVVH